MALTTAQLITQIYVGYYNRAPDPEGLNYWIGRVNAGVSLADIADSFAASPEALAAYPYLALPNVASAENFLTQVYQNLFNRAPDAEGLAYYAGKLASGATTPGQIIAEIQANANTNPNNTDGQILANKVAVASAWVDAAANTPNFQYNAAAASSASSVLVGVDETDASVTAGEAKADKFFAEIITGDKINLTVGVDAIVGTANNDLISVGAVNLTTGVDETTWGASDSIDGGAGKDTLAVQVKGANNATLYATTNVETVKIDNTLAASAAGHTAGTVNAAKFDGVENIIQIGKASAVTNLSASSVATFRGIDANTAFNVTAAATAASASVNFDAVQNSVGAEVTALNVAGDALNAVTVSGALVDSDPTTAPDASLALDVKAGKTVESVSVNTSVATTLTVGNVAGATKAVNTVDASASTGAITYAAGAGIASVKTGSGKDTVTLAFAGTATLAAASVATGAGDDVINVNVTKGAATAVTATVDAGEGNDTINLTIAAGVTYDVKAGAGDDTVVITGTVKTTDKIDGGEGNDTVSLTAKAAYVADDYIVFNKILTNFETLKLTGGTAANIDASKLADGYTTLNLNNGASVTGVGTQALIANGDLTATAAGYDASVPASVVYAGTLDVTEVANGTIIAKAETVNLTVDASKGNVAATLEGDFKAASATLVQALKADGSAYEGAASVTFTNSALIAKAATSFTVSGNGTATVTNVDTTKLVTIDASGLNSTTFDGKAAAGLTYTSDNTLAETIKLGAGIDVVTLNASTFGATDTVEGLNLVLNAAGTLLDATSDVLDLGASAGVYKKFVSTQTDFELLLKDAAASSDDRLVFQFDGDTYAFHDSMGAGLLDAGDVLVKLTGEINLDTLIIALA